MNYKYHYVVFGSEVEYFRLMFKDAIDNIGVEYISNPIKDGGYNIIMRFMYNLHHNPYLNWRIDLPGKRMWYPFFYHKQQTSPICFVFMMDWCKIQYRDLLSILRKKYTGCKIVLYLEDLIASRKGIIDFSFLKEYDYIVSYDKKDAEKYGFIYYPTFMSKFNMPQKKEKQSDACFWGVEKDRREVINNVYKTLTSDGFICDFFVTRTSDRSYYDRGIKTARHDKSYMQYLEAVNNTKCIVEIIQNKAVGFTLRTWESLLYGKILLTNNRTIINTRFYNPQQMIVFDNIHDIDMEILRDAMHREFCFDSGLISPVSFFNMLDRIL